jgi:hypothetical protein
MFIKSKKRPVRGGHGIRSSLTSAAVRSEMFEEKFRSIVLFRDISLLITRPYHFV